MSKLSNIEQSLKTNPEVKLVRKALDVSFPSTKLGCATVRTVDYFVTPKKGLCTAESLQKFMKALIPEEIEKAFERINFSEDMIYLNFGSLHFRDYHSPERTLIKINVRPFPSKAFVRDLLEKKESCSISFIEKENLENYKECF